jgi:Arc/MetJ-type ribon-helix-helix transcriptional regulator
MKLSVSLDTDDVEFIDQYATEHAVGSRSAVMQKAVALLRAVELGDDYAAAWAEWSQADDADLWDVAVNDGLDK